MDGVLQAQASADAEYFVSSIRRELRANDIDAVNACILEAYRWQYIVSGIRDGRFLGVLTELTDRDQIERITNALAPLMQAA